MKTTNELTIKDHYDHFLARWGWKRSSHIVKPGLYSLGNPDKDSKVFVTANYTLSFDALRSNLKDIDCHILVLDTKGINVWCAAGKGTFSTDELIKRIKKTDLKKVVKHRKLILPQLGSVGVAAHIIKKKTGFTVEYGPVRAEDIKTYLDKGADEDMRTVKFPIEDRFKLIPVEFVHVIKYIILSVPVMYFVDNIWGSVAALLALLGGSVLFPLLLPYLPSKNFSSKGFYLGFILAIMQVAFRWDCTCLLWYKSGHALAYLLGIPPIVAFLALNFTGASTTTSKTGVKKEIFAYVPWMAWMFGIAVIISISMVIARYLI